MDIPSLPPSIIIENFDKLPERLRNKKMWKDLAHEYFDLIWSVRKYSTRAKAYRALSEYLGKPIKQTHMSKFTNTECKEVVKWAISILNHGNRIDMMYKNHDWGFVKTPEVLFQKGKYKFY